MWRNTTGPSTKPRSCRRSTGTLPATTTDHPTSNTLRGNKLSARCRSDRRPTRRSAEPV